MTNLVEKRENELDAAVGGGVGGVEGENGATRNLDGCVCAAEMFGFPFGGGGIGIGDVESGREHVAAIVLNLKGQTGVVYGGPRSGMDEGHGKIRESCFEKGGA